MVSKNHRTSRIHQTKIIQALENIYISPLEICNLNCHYCYTKKTKAVLSQSQILNFIKRYSSGLKSYFLHLKSILFCGGEVFLLPWFPSLVNKLIDQNIFITIITNGTIDKLDQIKNPQNCQLIVSIDGPQKIHDQNRGSGNFQKSTKFIKKALTLGFPVEIFYLVTDISYPYISSFPKFIKKLYGQTIGLSFLTDRLGSLTPAQILNIKRNYPTYPPKNFGCFQLALQSNGLIYGCCESTVPLAKISDPPQTIIDNFLKSLPICHKCNVFSSRHCEELCDEAISTRSPHFVRDDISCCGCCQPDFLCGYIKQLNCQNCQQVVNLFNKHE